MLKQFIKLTIIIILVNISNCYQKHKMNLVRCVSSTNITNDLLNINNTNNTKKQTSNENKIIKQNYNVLLYSSTLNKDYKNIINKKKARIQYLKNRERNNFK